MMEAKVYVVASKWDGKVDNPDGDVWTLSPTPDTLGWETDMGCNGYGLPKELANKYSEAINQHDSLLRIARAAQCLSNRLHTDGGTLPGEIDNLDEALSALPPVEDKEKA